MISLFYSQLRRGLLLMVSLFALGLAARAADYSANAGFVSTTVKIEQRGMALSDFIRLVEGQSRFTFVYSDRQIPLAEQVTLETGEAVSLARLFTLISEQKPVVFESVNGKIAIRVVKAGEISGHIVDATSGHYLPGAVVAISGSGRETTAGRDGSFNYDNLPAGTYTLSVSYLGYKDAMSVVTVPQAAGTTIGLMSEAVEMGRFVVEGERAGQSKALQQKQNSVNTVDVVAADAMGKLPDGNAAEALRRLPGVVAEIDQSEGRYIVVRGIDSSLNNVTINGQLVGSPDYDTRAVPMDSVAADMISKIEVIKAVTPDMDHNAIGASINIVTPSAFDHNEPFGSLSSSIGYNRMSGRKPYAFSAAYGTTFGDGKWGFMIGASDSFRRYSSNLRDSGQWLDAGTWITGKPVTGFYVPSSDTRYNYDVERGRKGFNGALEFRPNDRLSLFFKGSYNTFRDDEGRQQVAYTFASGIDSNVTPTTGSFSQGQASRQFRSYLHHSELTNFQLGGKLKLGDGELDASVSTGVADNTTPRRIDWEFRSSATAFPSSYDVSDPLYSITPVAAFYDASKYPFRRVRVRSDKDQEQINAAELNYRLDSDLAGLAGYWKTGVRAVNRDKSHDRTNLDYTGAQVFTLADFGLSGPSPSDYYNGRMIFGPTLNYTALQSFFRDHPEYFKLDPANTYADSTTEDFDVKEDVYAGYLMREVRWGNWTLMGGARVENTHAEYAGNAIINGATPYVRVTGSKDYTNVLPGLHLRYEPVKRLVFRAAWTNTIGRPNYADLAPTQSFDYVETTPGRYTGGVSQGNPDLKPYKSMNVDAGVEYYFNTTGIASVSFFDKQIDNPIYDRGSFFTNYTFEGKTFDTITFSRPENAEDGRVTGLEVNLQQYFSFLPSPFDGFGVGANYTWTKSHVTAFVDQGNGTSLLRTTTFFKQSPGSGNLAFYYEKYGWQARIALNYSGKYLTSIGSDSAGDNYVANRKIWDSKLSYRFNEHWSSFIEFQNIDEAPLRQYTGQPGFVTGNEVYSWNANFGVTWKL